MPRKPKHPKDRPRVKATELQAMATLALAVKSELDALKATIPFGQEIFFRVLLVDKGEEGSVAALLSTHIQQQGTPKPSRNPPRLAGQLIGDMIKYVPALARKLERHGIVAPACSSRFNQVGKLSPNAPYFEVGLCDALKLLNEAIPALAARQGLGYRLNERLGGTISCYLAVLIDHYQASSPSNRKLSKGVVKPTGRVVVPITSWASMVAAFKTRHQHSHYPNLPLLGGSDSMRKRAGEVAHDIELVRILSTRRVELLPAGAKHHSDCVAAIKANQPLPDPFSR